jgi:hypothetical protein
LCPPTETESSLFRFQNFDDGIATGWFNVQNRIFDGSKTGFSKFLGPFNQDDKFPSKVYQVFDPSTVRLFFQFDFYELDSWDGNTGGSPQDTFGIRVEGDVKETVSFGHFRFNSDDKGLPATGVSPLGIKWIRNSAPGANSPQSCFVPTGCRIDFQDQRHNFIVEIPLAFFSKQRGVTLYMIWTMTGEKDEFVGVDNIRSIACIDTVPSQTPSVSPSQAPSNPPTNPPTKTPPVPSICKLDGTFCDGSDPNNDGCCGECRDEFCFTPNDYP